MQFNYFDIHSHLNLKPLYEQRADILARMKEQGIGTITVGVDYETSKLNLEIADEYEDVWACIGLHPADNTDEEFDIEKYRELTKPPKVVAIGECGLDYFRLVSSDKLQVARIKEEQKILFKKHIELAIETRKPLMIHARPSKGTMDAYEDAIEILSNYQLLTTNYKLIANFHFFVGDVTIAERIVKNGWTMSFDGPITFSRDYDEVIRFIPIENIMAETDAPFAAPAPYRGKTCEPWMVSEIVKKIAEIKDIPLETTQKAIRENVKRTFDI